MQPWHEQATIADDKLIAYPQEQRQKEECCISMLSDTDRQESD